MSNPRANITRTVLGPPPVSTATVVASSLGSPQVPEALATPNGRLIGKRHGKMRSVGLLLTRPAVHQLRRLSADHGITLGEALMAAVTDSLEAIHASAPAVSFSLRRTRTRIRRGVETTTVYVLLTPHEARHLAAAADSLHLSVSALASAAMEPTD